jgi:peptidyl-prolyl cis-trans isomerase A (cyclophilin A)
MSHWSRRVVLWAVLSFSLSGATWAQTHNPRVKLTTSLGEIVVELAQSRTPNTAANFLKYVASKHYDGTVFHRVIGNFMIQGGGFTPDMQQRTTQAPIALEIHPELKNVRGSIAMARTNNPHTATAQFFINVKDNPMLDAPYPDGHGYAVFGKVIEGMDVVDKIRQVTTGTSAGHRDVPLIPVVIRSAVLLK